MKHIKTFESFVSENTLETDTEKDLVKIASRKKAEEIRDEDDEIATDAADIADDDDDDDEDDAVSGDEVGDSEDDDDFPI
jgi:hypothetical protein